MYLIQCYNTQILGYASCSLLDVTTAAAVLGDGHFMTFPLPLLSRGLLFNHNLSLFLWPLLSAFADVALLSTFDKASIVVVA